MDYIDRAKVERRERRAGNSRLVYDKKRRTIVTVYTPWWLRVWRWLRRTKAGRHIGEAEGEMNLAIIQERDELRAEIERLKATLREVKEMTPSHYAREHAIIDAVLGERSKES